MARDCGAKKVYFASCAPPIRFPNVYGIDMPSRSELVASGRTEQQVAEEIGADLMIYQDLDDLSKACLSVLDSSPRALISPHNSSHRDPGEWYREPYKITGFDMSVFDGKYITGDITPEFLNRLESNRGASTKNPVLIPSHSKRDSPRVGSPSVTSHHPPLELLGSSYSTSEFDLEIARHKIPGMNGDETPPRIRDAETVGLHNNYSRR